jgi:hypothetical protein
MKGGLSYCFTLIFYISRDASEVHRESRLVTSQANFPSEAIHNSDLPPTGALLFIGMGMLLFQRPGDTGCDETCSRKWGGIICQIERQVYSSNQCAYNLYWSEISWVEMMNCAYANIYLYTFFMTMVSAGILKEGLIQRDKLLLTGE